MSDLGPVTEGQVTPIYNTEVADGRIKSTASPYGYINFSIPEITLNPDALYEVAIQVERDPQYEINWNADCYSVLPPGDTVAADGSYWYWLGGNQYGHTSDTMRFVVGPGMFDHGAALAAGETGLHIELYGVQVLGIVWREMPTNGPMGSSDWTTAPEIPLDTMSVETPDGDSNSPGDVVDPALEFDAVWWKHACTESGYYQFDAFGSRPESDTLYGYHDGYSIYVHEDSPVADPQAVGFTSRDAENSEAEGWGLVHMDAGKTYYFKVLYSKLNNQWATQTPSMYRFRLSKSLYSRLPDQGSPYPWDAPEMPPGGISRYTPNYMLSGGMPWASLSRVAWWKFTATQDGLIGMDVYKTRFRPDGVFTDANAWSLTPYVDLYIFTKGTDGSYDYVYEGSGWDEMEVETGVTYYFALGKDDYDERPMDYVFRMSEYAQTARWVPGSRVLTYGATDPAHAGNQTVTNANDNYMDPKNGYYGDLELWRSFGGDQPGSDPAAVECMWEHAKIGDHGSYWWSPNNGTQWNGGPGTCPAINTAYRESMADFSDDTVGVYFTSYGGSNGEAEVRIFGTVQALNLSDAWRRLTYRAGWTLTQYNDNARAAVGAPSNAWVQPDDSINCELLGAEIAPDERVSTAGSNVGTVKWYGGLTRPDNNSWNGGFVTTRWGPVISRVHSDYRSFGGGGGGASELQADYAHLADYSGGLAGWITLDHVAIRAHERAENNNPNDNGSISGGSTGYLIPGFVAAAIPQDMLGAHPFTPATDTTQSRIRYYQRCVFRITVNPSPATVTWPVVYDEQTPADAPPDPAWSWQKVKGWIVGMIGWS